MKPLRAYLLVRTAPNAWTVTTHRDLDSLRDAWRPFAARSEIVGIVHVGFERPETDEFDGIASRFVGRILLTAPARYSIPEPSAVADCAAGVVRQMPVYVAVEGWGYSCTAEDLGLDEGVDEAWESGSAPSLTASGWVATLQDKDQD